MILSPEQTRALDKLHHWATTDFYHTNSPFILAGYAGTGKTTLMQHYINEHSEPILCCAPTGKAASVLQKKLTNARVQTVHSALYKPVNPSIEHLQALQAALAAHPGNLELQEAVEAENRRLNKRGPSFSLKEESSIIPGQLVIVDEASMVTQKMYRDLVETRARVIFVGDPGQLPPVMDRGFFEHSPPNAMLEEIQRQALDSPIIRASMKIRKGETIMITKEGPFQKMPIGDYPYNSWLNFDQVITGTNQKRRKINGWFRRKKFPKPSWWPMDGDKLICLSNEMDDAACYINGVQATSLSNCIYDLDNDLLGSVLYEGLVLPISFYRYPFQAHYDPKAVEIPRQLLYNSGLKQFDYAYAITAHKSQGSEWDKVLIADDHMTESVDFRRRWLYTAITRGKKEVLWLY